MISTPICDFVRAYAAGKPARFHMPGHKGRGPLGCEEMDITEIDGADELLRPSGVIAQSEENAGMLFGAHTFYSTEGSSLCIRAMLFLAAAAADRRDGARPAVLAARNVHAAFLSAAVLLDLDVTWLHPREDDPRQACRIRAEDVERSLCRMSRAPAAVYLTSPDYLGNLADVPAIARVCRSRNVPLLVDDAHGAYLRFLPGTRHPIQQGADMCCDSAHKTLGVLTGGAYLHVSRQNAFSFERRAREALSLFASTSPSYLILQSLDAANPALEALPARLERFLPRLSELRQKLAAHGYTLCGDEPMKLTVQAGPFGWTGDCLAALLSEKGVICELHDPDFLVLMPSPDNTEEDLRRLEEALLSVPAREPIRRAPPPWRAPAASMSPRAACFAPREILPAEECLGRTLAAPSVSCPPAVPIVMCGEVIDSFALARMRWYGVKECSVVASGREG